MDQMVLNRVWGGVQSRVWNRRCRIMYGCEIVYGIDDVESCMAVRCEVMYGTDGVESCMVVRCEVIFGQIVLNRAWLVRCEVVNGSDVWTRWCGIVYGGEVRHAWNIV